MFTSKIITNQDADGCRRRDGNMVTNDVMIERKDQQGRMESEVKIQDETKHQY